MVYAIVAKRQLQAVCKCKRMIGVSKNVFAKMGEARFLQ
jgi:hypothetical protein